MNFFKKNDDLKMIDAHTIFIWVKTWWISLTGAFSTMISAWFSGTLILFIDPDAAAGLAKIVGSIITLSIGVATLWYTIKERRLEVQARINKIELDKNKDDDLHIIEVIRKLEEIKVIDPNLPIADKIELAKKYIIVS